MAKILNYTWKSVRAELLLVVLLMVLLQIEHSKRKTTIQESFDFVCVKFDNEKKRD